jgi:hypothetical protein
MNKLSLLLLIQSIFSLNHPVSGQNKIYLGIESGVANDIYTIKDNGEHLKSVPLINIPWGLNVRQELKRNFFVETGFIVKFYQEGFGFKTVPYYGVGSDDASWLIPMRLGLSKNLFKRKIYLVPVIGYTFGIHPPYGYGLGYGSSASGSTVFRYNYTENPNSSRYFSLIQAGVGFEFSVFRTMLFSISANYYKGLNIINQLDINYTMNNSAPITGSAISKGDFWCAGAGLKYPISKFWKKK